MTQLTIVADMHARPERLDEIKAALIALVEPTRAEAGCVNYDLHQDNNDPLHFCFMKTGPRTSFGKHTAIAATSILFARQWTALFRLLMFRR